MGDTQAVELAQTCHLGLCLQHNILKPEELIAISLPIPRGPVLNGIVIDDFLSLAISTTKLEKESGECTEGARIAEKAMATYKEVQLIPHEDKATRDELKGESWGVQVDGSEGFVRGSLKRAVPLVKIILEVLELGVISGGLVEVIAGSLIGLFIYRRRLMCLLDEVFESVKGRDQQSVFVVSPALREELLLCVVGLLVSVVELRAESELRSFLRAEKKAKVRGEPTRCVIGGDSQVALGALLKGRSSSRQLNKELSRSLAFHIGAGMQPYYLYFPTTLNPGDHPTRDREIPEPTDTEPGWWEPLLRGDFRLLDRWLEGIGHDPFTLSG